MKERKKAEAINYEDNPIKMRTFSCYAMGEENKQNAKTQNNPTHTPQTPPHIITLQKIL